MGRFNSTGRFGGGRFTGGRFVNGRFGSVSVDGAFRVNLTGLTSGVPRVGTTIGYEIEWLGAAGTVTGVQWLSGGDEIDGATEGTLGVLPAIDATALALRVDTAEFGSVTSPAVLVRRAPPVADGTMADRVLTLGDAQTTFTGDLGNRFVGDDLTFTVAGHSSLFVDGTALRCLPDTVADDVTITVTATNSGGEAYQQFQLTIEEVSNWIMATGSWNDAGVWDDAAQWKDAA